MSTNTKRPIGKSNQLYEDAGLLYQDTAIASAAEIGAKNGATVAYTECIGGGPFFKTKLTCTATPITFSDEAGQGQYGGVKVFDFPAGLLMTLGFVVDGSLTLIDTTGTWTATFGGDIALGTSAPVDHQVGLAIANTSYFMQKQDTATAAAKVAVVDAQSAATSLTESSARTYDGTAAAPDLYLNFLIDDAAAHADGDGGTFTGTIEFVWAILGDN